MAFRHMPVLRCRTVGYRIIWRSVFWRLLRLVVGFAGGRSVVGRLSGRLGVMGIVGSCMVWLLVGSVADLASLRRTGFGRRCCWTVVDSSPLIGAFTLSRCRRIMLGYSTFDGSRVGRSGRGPSTTRRLPAFGIVTGVILFAGRVRRLVDFGIRVNIGQVVWRRPGWFSWRGRVIRRIIRPVFGVGAIGTPPPIPLMPPMLVDVAPARMDTVSNPPPTDRDPAMFPVIPAVNIVVTPARRLPSLVRDPLSPKATGTADAPPVPPPTAEAIAVCRNRSHR